MFPVVADLNRDGMPDIAVGSGTRPVLGAARQRRWRVLPATSHGTNGAIVVRGAADLDGDGNIDLVAQVAHRDERADRRVAGRWHGSFDAGTDVSAGPTRSFRADRRQRRRPSRSGRPSSHSGDRCRADGAGRRHVRRAGSFPSPYPSIRRPSWTTTAPTRTSIASRRSVTSTGMAARHRRRRIPQARFSCCSAPAASRPATSRLRCRIPRTRLPRASLLATR